MLGRGWRRKSNKEVVKDREMEKTVDQLGNVIMEVTAMQRSAF